MGYKKQQRWLWYTWLPHLKTVLAYTLGARTEHLEALINNA